VLKSTLDRIAGEPRIELAGVEGPLGELAALDTVPAGVPCYVETPRGDLDTIAQVAAAGHGAKIRCGGLRAELFPSAEEVAAFIGACVRQGVAFKATAGLHHALPNSDPATGFAHHGFLNLLLATGRAVAGAPADELIAVLRCTDAAALAAEARAITPDAARATRAAFVAYGSCSTRDPLSDLEELGLLTPAAVSA
jgi:hypothetical protein